MIKHTRFLILLAGAVFFYGQSGQAMPTHPGGFHAGAMHQSIHPGQVNQDTFHARHPEAKTGLRCNYGGICDQSSPSIQERPRR